MSWPRRVVALLAMALLVGACQVRPLYGSAPDGEGARQALPAIAVDAPATRPEQVFRNALLFGLRGGGAGEAPRYGLNYRMVLVEQPLAVQQVTGTPTSYQVVGNVSIILQDTTSGAYLLTDRATAVASFNRSTQNFANIRARRDAEDRVAEALARLVETRLAAYFAEQ